MVDTTDDNHILKKVVGLKQSKRVVEAGDADIAYVAFDAQEQITQPFVKLCMQKGVPIVSQFDMKQLAAMCKVDVPTAVMVTTKQQTS